MQQLTKGALLRGGSYQIEEVLGQGSFGITYLAEHVNLGKKVAIKEFFMKELNSRGEDGSITGMTDGSLSHNYYNKFKKESINLSRLDHPNIVRVTDSFDENGTFYYVMDYIEGQNLNDYIKQHNVSESEAVEIIKSVADALIYMHEKNHMLHLDLKPGNIMRRNNDGHIFLIDFGLSKHYSSDGQPETSTTIGLGTPGYAPIEQANRDKNGEIRPTIDVYSLGATFYKLLTGVTPPAAADLVSDDELLESSLRTKGIPETYIKVITEAMCPNVRKRTQTIRDFKDNLSGIVCSANTAAQPQNVQANTEETLFTPTEIDPIVEPVSPNDTNVEQEQIEEERQEKHSIFSFKGRVGRLQYWIVISCGLLAFYVLGILALMLYNRNAENIMFALGGMLGAFFYYYIALAAGSKRCHDLGHSGWFQLIPFYGLVMLFSSGDEKDNEYGKKGNGISKDSLKNLGIVVVVAFVIFGIIGRGFANSITESTNSTTQHMDSEIVDTVAAETYDSGYHEVTYDDGSSYKGYFKNGLYNGAGTLEYPNETRDGYMIYYKGNLKNGVFMAKDLPDIMVV